MIYLRRYCFGYPPFIHRCAFEGAQNLINVQLLRAYVLHAYPDFFELLLSLLEHAGDLTRLSRPLGGVTPPSPAAAGGGHPPQPWDLVLLRGGHPPRGCKELLLLRGGAPSNGILQRHSRT